MATLTNPPLSQESIQEINDYVEYRLVELGQENDFFNAGNLIYDCFNEVRDNTFIVAFVEWNEGGQVGERPSTSNPLPTAQEKTDFSLFVSLKVVEDSVLPRIEEEGGWIMNNIHQLTDTQYVADYLLENS